MDEKDRGEWLEMLADFEADETGEKKNPYLMGDEGVSCVPWVFERDSTDC